MSKRRQRSTAIRKRIEKRTREEEKAKRRKAKADGAARGEVALVRTTLERDKAEACAAALEDLGERLAREAIRGWTRADVEGDHGLLWLAALLREALDLAPESDPLPLELFDDAKTQLLDRLGALEIAASGLRLAWDEAGFDALLRAVSRADEAADEEGEEEEEEAAASSDADAEAGSSDEAAPAEGEAAPPA